MRQLRTCFNSLINFTAMNSQEIKPLNIKSLLSEGRYVIPIYQRNYDWGENEALQLIEDITDYASFNSSKITI